MEKKHPQPTKTSMMMKPKLTAGNRDGSASTETHAKSFKRVSKLTIGRAAFVAPSDTGSVISSTLGNNKHLSLEPTYRLVPEEDSKFKEHNVTSVLQGIIDSRLANVTYQAEQCARISQDLATVIKSRVREMEFPRYKIIATVTIGENKGQGVKMASRFLWNTSTDDFATASFVNKELYAVAAVYGLYLD